MSQGRKNRKEKKGIKIAQGERGYNEKQGDNIIMENSRLKRY